MKSKMLLSEFIEWLESKSNKPNVVQFVKLLKNNLKQYGDVTVDLNDMLKVIEKHDKGL